MFNLLADGMGGLRWEALPLIVGWLGIDDIEALMDRLSVIKLHRKDKSDATGNA